MSHNRFNEMSQDAIKLFINEDYIKAMGIYFQMEPLTFSEDRASVLNNIGLCYYGLRDYENALKYVDFALELNPSSEYFFQKSLCLLNLGRKEEGIKFYSYRDLKIRTLNKGLKLEDLEGQDVIVFKEQGFGDEIMFLRGYEAVKKTAKNLYWQVSKEMLSLFKHNFKGNFFVDLNDIKSNLKVKTTQDIITKYKIIYTGDAFCYSYDNSTPLLTHKTTKEGWTDETEPDKLKIGFVYKANEKSLNFKKRSLDIDFFKKLSDSKKDAVFYNLQKNDLEKGNFINMGLEYNDFNELAQIISEMDCIYTVDTATLHLSLALGKKTYFLFKDYIDWRWLHFHNYAIQKEILTLVKVGDSK